MEPNDHDTLIVLVEQSKQLASILTKMDVRQETTEAEIISLRMSRVQFHAVAATISTIGSFAVSLLIKIFWK